MVGRYVSLKIMGNALFNDTGVEMTWKRIGLKKLILISMIIFMCQVILLNLLQTKFY